MSWFLLNRNLTLLEPYDWKLSCTVLRGERGSNAPDLPGKKAKITQAELARRIGSDRSYISRVESGQTEPKVSTFYRIMNALGCRIEFSMSL